MKNILTLLIIIISLSQTLAQLWVKTGNDFIADTTYYNGLNDICIDSLATKVVISLTNQNLQTGEKVYLTQAYSRNNGLLTELGNPILGNPNADSEVTATKLSADGNTLIIGRRSYNFQGINLAGVIEVYQLDGNNNWAMKGDSIGGYGTAAGFGISVDISRNGNTIIAGGDENNIFLKGGHVRIFDWDGNNWIQKGDSIRQEEAYALFGHSVNINNNGNIIAVGAKKEIDTINNINQAGSVTIYQWSGINWEQMGQKFYGENYLEKLGRKNGFSLSDDGKTIVIGYSRFDGDKGAIKIYQWDAISSLWTQKGNSLFGLQSKLGEEVNISGNGESISVTGDYGIQIFKYDASSNTWIRIGQKINEPQANIDYGFLNFDGTVLSTPGTLYLPEYSYLYTSLVRFYEFDEVPVNINDKTEKNQILIYPNPSNRALNIQLNKTKDYNLIITDIFGRVILNQKASFSFYTVDLSRYTKGMYIVSVLENNKLIWQEKLTLQ